MSQERVTYLGLRGKKLNHAIALIAGIGFLLFGFDQGVLGGLLSLPEFLETFPRMKDSTIQGTVVSLYEIGCLIGALLTMRFGDQFGRRKVIFFGAIVMIIGATLQSSAFTLAHLIVGRIITGIGNGFITSSTPLWQSEIAKPSVRGKLVMIEGALITGGIMISYWLDFAFFFVKGSVNWRFPIAFQVLLALIIVAFVLQLPDSPRWLIKKDRVEEARIVFSALDDIDIDHHLITAQIEEIVATLVDESRSNAPIKRMFTFGREKHFHRAMLGFWNQAAQQLTGINLVSYGTEGYLVLQFLTILDYILCCLYLSNFNWIESFEC